MAKKYQIHLSDEQRQQLTKLVKTGKSSARVIRRAHTLLLAAEGYTDAEIARLLPVIPNQFNPATDRADKI